MRRLKFSIELAPKTVEACEFNRDVLLALAHLTEKLHRRIIKEAGASVEVADRHALLEPPHEIGAFLQDAGAGTRENNDREQENADDGPVGDGVVDSGENTGSGGVYRDRNTLDIGAACLLVVGGANSDDVVAPQEPEPATTPIRRRRSKAQMEAARSAKPAVAGVADLSAIDKTVVAEIVPAPAPAPASTHISVEDDGTRMAVLETAQTLGAELAAIDCVQTVVDLVHGVFNSTTEGKATPKSQWFLRYMSKEQLHKFVDRIMPILAAAKVVK